MKHLPLASITSACLFLIFITYGRCEDGHFQPAKGKTIEQTLKEAKEEHSARAAARRAELPLLKRKLLEEKIPGRRESIVSSLGDTEDAQAVDPLTEVLQNGKEDLNVRRLSVQALYTLYRPSLSSGKSLDIKDRQKISTAMKTTYEKEAGVLKCSIASHLYQMGEKKLVKEGILECLKKGRWQQLNSFVYNRKIDGVMIFGLLPGEDYPIKVDADAHEILNEASGLGYPEEIRVKAAGMLVRLGDKDAALKAGKDVVENGKVLEWRVRALELMCKIGTPEAKSVLDNAVTVKELKPVAEDILKWSWGK